MESKIKSKISFACRSCNSYDCLSLRRYVIDKTLCLQLITCAKCGYRYREIWSSQKNIFNLPLAFHSQPGEKEEKRVRRRKERVVQWQGQEWNSELKIRLEL